MVIYVVMYMKLEKGLLSKPALILAEYPPVLIYPGLNEFARLLTQEARITLLKYAEFLSHSDGWSTIVDVKFAMDAFCVGTHGIQGYW